MLFSVNGEINKLKYLKNINGNSSSIIATKKIIRFLVTKKLNIYVTPIE